MKKYPYKIVAIVWLLVLSNYAMCDAMVEKSKKSRQSFPIGETTEINITSKYGKIDIRNWEKDSVAFEIEIIGKTKTDEASMDMVNGTNVSIDADKHLVRVQSIFFDGTGEFMTKLNKVAGSITGTRAEIKVNMIIYLPKNNDLVIDYNFGDLRMADRSGKVNIIASHSDIRVQNIMAKAHLDLKFSTFNGQHLSWVSVVSSYSKFACQMMDNASFDSRGSKMNITEVASLRIQSKRDDYTIYKAGRVNSLVSYSDMVITELSKSISFSGKYSDLTIHEIQNTFTQVSMNSDQSNANLSFDKSCKFSIDVSLEDGHMAYSMGFMHIDKREDNNGDVRTYFGKYGENTQNPGASALVEIFGKGTDVNLTIQ